MEKRVFKPRQILWLKVSGVCGIIAPFVAFSLILLSIHYALNFNWINDALSDLGVMTHPVSTLFNSGLIITGVVALVFSSGFFISFKGKIAGRVGTLLFMLDCLSLIAIGVFPETSKPMHLYASIGFFALFPLAMFFLTASFLLASERQMAWFTFSISVFASTVWITEFLIQYVPGVAIPETLSALAASTWTVVIGLHMTRAKSASRIVA